MSETVSYFTFQLQICVNIFALIVFSCFFPSCKKMIGSSHCFTSFKLWFFQICFHLITSAVLVCIHVSFYVKLHAKTDEFYCPPHPHPQSFCCCVTIIPSWIMYMCISEEICIYLSTVIHACTYIYIHNWEIERLSFNFNAIIHVQIHDVVKFSNASTNSQRERPWKVPGISAEAESAQQTE